MNLLWAKLERGECSAEELKWSNEFCDLVIKKIAQRRGLRPDQVRCSFNLQVMGDPEILGPEDTYRPEHDGLH
ncbi:hypothetical protein A1OO_08770 [Enterovibrio norvegicus FF-33]|nr:hypothetical protein A1OO_08770 [Enterovibrio norvegicus FF-33]